MKVTTPAPKLSGETATLFGVDAWPPTSIRAGGRGSFGTSLGAAAREPQAADDDRRAPASAPIVRLEASPATRPHRTQL